MGLDTGLAPHRGLPPLPPAGEGWGEGSLPHASTLTLTLSRKREREPGGALRFSEAAGEWLSVRICKRLRCSGFGGPRNVEHDERSCLSHELDFARSVRCPFEGEFCARPQNPNTGGQSSRMR